jgi:hypothetical protein
VARRGEFRGSRPYEGGTGAPGPYGRSCGWVNEERNGAGGWLGKVLFEVRRLLLGERRRVMEVNWTDDKIEEIYDKALSSSQASPDKILR